MVKRLKKAWKKRLKNVEHVGTSSGVSAVFEEYVGIVKTLQELQSDKKSGALATTLLKKLYVKVCQVNV